MSMASSFRQPPLLLCMALWLSHVCCLSSMVDADKADADLSIDEIITKASKRPYHNSPVTYDTEDDVILTDLDVAITPTELESMIAGGVDKRTAANHNTKKRWPKGVVSYEFQENQFSVKDKKNIRDAMDYWSNFTCLKFVETNKPKNRIFVFGEKGCYSYVGMIGGAQKLALGRGCRSRKGAMHEIGHALGFNHEQIRPDRDDYITIVYENVRHDAQHSSEFRKSSFETGIQNLGVPYDYLSIMHIGRLLASKNGEITVKTKDPMYQQLIGHQEALSYLDIKSMNLMYNCAGVEDAQCNLTASDCPSEGFVGRDCTCWCPGDPVKHCQKKDDAVHGTVGAECVDLESHCPSWAKNGLCWWDANEKKFHQHINTKCRKSCKLC